MLRKDNKRKRNNSESETDWDSDLEELILQNNKKRLSTLFVEQKQKYNNVENAVNNKIINLNDVFKLNLPMDENIWFFEYLQILENTDPFTEEHYRIKNMIYDRYNNLKSVDIEKLNKIKTNSGVDHDVVTRILNSDHSDELKTILYRKYKRCYDNMSRDGHSDELFKVIEWIDNVLDLPTKIINKSKTSISEKLSKLWKSLNNNIYGLQHVKEKVMEAVCAKLLDPDNKGSILTFVGPPGVGKTAMATSIAEALDMPFDQISFGSVKDSAILTGQTSVWIGSAPSLFTKILLKSKRLDTVVLLDEIDKIPYTQEGRSISSVLLHVLDRTQNHRFKDMYMPEVSLDLSKMVFLCAANSLDDIDPVLRDRMTIIEISGYSTDEKVNIASIHMFPKISKELGFTNSDLLVGQDALKYLVDNKTNNQSGMREVERKLYQLCERLSLLKYAKGIPFSYKITNVKFPYKIDIDTINKLL